MKHIRKGLPLLFFLTLTPLNRADIFDEVIKAFKSGQADQVANYLCPRPEIQFPDGTSGQKSKAEAVDLLRQFMKENPVKSMEIKHRGPAGDPSFVIAKYQSQNGKSFRVTLFVSGTGEKAKIQELKFENS